MLIRFQSRLSFRQKSFEKFIESERQKHLRWNLKNSQIESLLRKDNNSIVTEIKLINDEEIYKKVYTFCPVTLQPMEHYFINDKLYQNVGMSLRYKIENFIILLILPFGLIAMGNLYALLALWLFDSESKWY